MQYAKKMTAGIIILFCAFYSGCTGAIEQPGFVNIFLPETGGNTLKEFELLSGNVAKLTFEGAVSDIQVQALRGEPGETEEAVLCSVEWEKTAYGTVFTVKPQAEFGIGEKFTLKGSVKTRAGVLDFSLPFEGFNTRPALLAFYAVKLGSTSNPGYIKFKVLSEGNLLGLNLLSPADTKAAEYTFPAAEVKKGETVTYHRFLPKDEHTAIDETESPDQSSADGALNTERDFWGRFSKFNPKKTNALLLKTSKTGAIQDAVIFMHPDEEEWGSSEVERAVKEAVNAEKWLPDASAENTVRENITPATRIIRTSMQDITHSAQDWKKEKISGKTRRKVAAKKKKTKSAK